MLVPLIILASLAILSGYVGTPWANAFEHHMMPVLGHHYAEMLEEALHGFGYQPGFHILIFLLGTFSALAGIGLATIIWLVPVIKIEKFNVTPFKQIAYVVENKYFFDELYQATVIRTLMLAAKFQYWFDRWVIDYAIVNGVGYLSLLVSRAWGWFDKNIVDGCVNLVGWVTKTSGNVLRYFQTGVAQQYVFLMVVALILISIAVLIGHYSEETWIPFRIAGFYRP
jgi:NADH-quinone oxidoreductase subunit L